MIPKTKKIVILGTTGSGKTTFLKHFAKHFDTSAEVKRNIKLEEAQLQNTFSITDQSLFEDSTTTTSMNVQQVMFYTTYANQFDYACDNYPDIINCEDVAELYPTFLVDTAGQERFDFMQEICIKGADAILIFADGTNIQSIERVSHYIRMTREEERRKATKIPIMVFINKKDLKERGIYVGSSFLENILPPEDRENLEVFETSNLDLETFIFPFRILLDKFDDFPLLRHEMQRTIAAI